MEHLSMQRAKDLIAETHFVGEALHQRVYSFKTGQSLPENDVKRFISKLKACHFFSFDSESKGDLKCSEGTCNRLFSSMSCPKTGTTFSFYDSLDIPKPIVKCIEDYAIAKSQSGITNDVKLFKECARINVRGVVDSGTLFLMVDPHNTAEWLD